MNDVPRGLLRETLRGRMTSERGAGCLDSQTLAAWSEGTLSARDREAIEEHASDCARCQALLAAMVATAPTSAPSRWWRPSRFGWLAPLTAVAAAMLLWINVPRSPVEQPVTAPAVVTAKPDAPARDAAPPPAAAAARTSPQVPEGRPAETRRQERAKAVAGGTTSLPSRPAPRVDTQAADAVAQTKGAVESAKDLPMVGKSTPVESSAATPAPPAVRRRRQAQLRAKFEGASGGRGGAGGGTARFRATLPDIVSPDASVRWRILPGGEMARSIDRGATWQPQSTGASVMFTAGAAPSRDVCWLVGPAGIIVVSTDGLTWQRVAFPQAIDLTAVRASDASNATVTTIDGRTFTTTDGGKNWRQP